MSRSYLRAIYLRLAGVVMLVIVLALLGGAWGFAADRIAAMTYVQSRYAVGEIVTGLLHVDPDPEDLHAHLNTIDQPFNRLGEKELCPGAAALDKFNAAHR